MSEIQTTNYPSTAKVLVRSENASRTALGIANAYLLIHPDATVEQLNQAFPGEKVGLGKAKMFLGPKERQEFVAALKQHKSNDDPEKSLKANYFYEDINKETGKSEMITLKNGDNVAVRQMWSKEMLPQLVECAKQHDIYVAAFEEGARGKQGYYKLEYLNNWKPIVIEKIVEKEVVREVEKKHIPWWVWLLLALAVVGIIVALLCRPKGETQVVSVTDTVVKTVIDTVYVQQLEQIEDNFNAAEFQKDKADLSEDAKFVLHDLAKLMNRYPELKLRIEGHTSAEGDAAHNQKLSEARAQAAVDFLVAHGGIDASRLEAAGFGSSKPKNADDPMAPENRRTEFEIIK